MDGVSVMGPRGRRNVRVVSAARREPLIPSSVAGMAIFIITELMLFAGLISGFTVIRAGALVWPPPGQPRLPFEETAFNTGMLLLSGVFLVVARRRFGRDRASAATPLMLSMILGGLFVVLQGAEWVALLREGLTLTSSSLGSFFYLIVGVHGLHAVIALGLLANAWLRLRRGWLASSQLAVAEIFWYFVVGIWPVLWLVVYR